MLLACVVAFLLYLTFTAEHRVDTVANRERPAVVVDVTGVEVGVDVPLSGVRRSPRRSGTVGRQPLVVPAGEAVRFNLSSSST